MVRADGALRPPLGLEGATIGPRAPPAELVPLEFLNSLIALRHDSREAGWVTGDGIHQSLLAKLLAAKRSLEAGRPEPARGQLQAFLHEVEAVACPQLACPRKTPLTSEAYALLAFNGHYLWERLPEGRYARLRACAAGRDRSAGASRPEAERDDLAGGSPASARHEADRPRDRSGRPAQRDRE